MRQDPEGQIVPLLIGAWAVAEIGLSGYDIYSTANTIVDPNASLGEKITSGGLTIAGIALLGGGYGKLGKEATQIYPIEYFHAGQWKLGFRVFLLCTNNKPSRIPEPSTKM